MRARHWRSVSEMFSDCIKTSRNNWLGHTFVYAPLCNLAVCSITFLRDGSLATRKEFVHGRCTLLPGGRPSELSLLVSLKHPY